MEEENKFLAKTKAWPWATLFIMGICVFVFWVEQRALNVGVLGYMIEDYHFEWASFVADPFHNAPRLLSHSFFHANTAHLVSNLVFFVLFAPSVERRLGTLVFFVSYVIWAVLAALFQGFFSPFSKGLIGASGAISGAAGAFFVLFPLKVPPRFLAVMLGKWIRTIPAFFWIGIYFLNQLWLGVHFLLPEELTGTISRIGYWAHVGGFGAGGLTVLPFLLFGDDVQTEN